MKLPDLDRLCALAVALTLQIGVATAEPYSASNPPPASFLFAGPVNEPLADGQTAVKFRYVVALHSVTPTKIEIVDAGTGQVLVSDNAPQLKPSALKHPSNPAIAISEWSAETGHEVITASEPVWLHDGSNTRVTLEVRVHSADQPPLSFKQEAMYRREAKQMLIRSAEHNKKVKSASTASGITVLARNWQIGHNARNDQLQVTEYVLPGQTVHDWKELLTRQMFVDPTSKISLSRLLEVIRRGFGSDCKDMQWTIIKQTDREATVGWSHSGCAKYPAQAERFLFTRTPAGLCRWAYTTKSPPLAQEAEAALDAELAKLPCE